jgi:hypothetical protein
MARVRRDEEREVSKEKEKERRTQLAVGNQSCITCDCLDVLTYYSVQLPI